MKLVQLATTYCDLMSYFTQLISCKVRFWTHILILINVLTKFELLKHKCKMVQTTEMKLYFRLQGIART